VKPKTTIGKKNQESTEASRVKQRQEPTPPPPLPIHTHTHTHTHIDLIFCLNPQTVIGQPWFSHFTEGVFLTDSYNKPSGMLGLVECILLKRIFFECLTLKMMVLRSFETSVAVYQSTWPNVKMHLNLQQRSCLKPTSKNNYIFCDKSLITAKISCQRNYSYMKYYQLCQLF